MKRFIFLSVLIAVFIISGTSTFASEPKFTDVSGHWAEEIINKMAGEGLINGVGGNKFMPDGVMKRSHFVALLHKALDIQIRYFKATDITELYEDVKNEDWFAAQLYDLASAGIIDERVHFRGDEPITREEIAHYAVKAYAYKQMQDVKGSVDSFSDKSEIKPEYADDVGKAVKLGIILGKGNNIFNPKGDSTRAETLVVVNRLLSTLEKTTDAVEVTPSFENNAGILTMKVSITNKSQAAISINYTSGQKYDFVLFNSDKKEIYRWSADRFFTMNLSSTEIGAGESIEFKEAIDTKTYGDAAYLKVYLKGECDAFKINPDGYEISVK